MSTAVDPETILDRLRSLYPALIDLSLGRLDRLLDRLGHPERRLPPVLHVAGTNGKGSTCAVARAVAEAAGLRVHVMTSPHLVSITERFRLAGRLVTTEALSETLAEIEASNAGEPITLFEALTAAGFLLFARVPADLAIVEVGLGGRYDATNVVTTTVVSMVTSISLDHQDFLGDTLAGIAAEKAGIVRAGRPCVTGRQVPDVMTVLEASARDAGAALLVRDRDWTIEPASNGLVFADEQGTLCLPVPALAGAHQHDNAGIAVAALRRSGLVREASAYGAIADTRWPARMQRLVGHLARRLPADFALWLDGGHNEGGAAAIADMLDAWRPSPCHLVVGMKDGKDAAAFFRPLLPHVASLHLVRETAQAHSADLATLQTAANGTGTPVATLEEALDRIGQRAPGPVLICGSLYLAAVALEKDGYRPA